MKKSWFKLALTHRAIPCIETYVGGVGGSLHVEVFRCAVQIAERGERPIYSSSAMTEPRAISPIYISKTF